MKGLLITLEGGDGCGKSTHARLLKEYLDQKGIPAVLTEEPGGTPLGHKIKNLLLNPKYEKMDPKAELLLFAAARAEHVTAVITPNLEAGNWVVSSRFSDATWVYQGCGRGLDKSMINQLAEIATKGLKPDLTILLDVDPEKGLDRTKRTQKEASPEGMMDKIEAEGIEFQKKVRAGYLELAQKEPHRFYIISTEEKLKIVQEKIRETCDSLLAKR